MNFTAPGTYRLAFPAAGAYPYELDYSKGGDSRLTLTMLADGQPIPAAALLTLTPQRLPAAVGGTVTNMTLSAVDGAGNALANLPVTFLVDGPNPQLRVVTTDGAGTAGFAYVGSPLRLGNDVIFHLALASLK